MVALIDQAQKQTVQKLPEAEKQSSLQYFATHRNELLPRWGSRRREQTLRGWERHPYNTMLQGAVGGFIKRVLATPWEIQGPPNDATGGVERWQEFLRDMQFGMGWAMGMGPFIRDFFRQDIGAFMEVIGPGNPANAMTGPPVGMAYLDAMRCTPTGDPDFPVIYLSQDGKKHVMHRTRVFRLLDMPDSDETRPGPIGLCAVSRLAALIQREVLMGRYVEAFLDDKPKPGILLGRNISEGAWNAALLRYRETINRDDMGEWGKTVFISGLAVDQPIDLQPIAFTQAPEKFDFKVYTVEIDVPMMALALGIDPQDIWPLSGQKMGTNTQSEILHAKGQGKAFGYVLQQLEREINDTLPDAYEFQFKYRDEQQDRERADNAQVWVGMTQTLPSTVMSDDEKRQLLANMIEPIKDVITDDNGQVVRLDDVDPKEDPTDNLLPPFTPQPSPEASGEAASPDSAGIDDTQSKGRVEKDFSTTRTQFVIMLENAIQVAQDGVGNPSAFRVQLREMLRTYGRDAYGDGLEEGGVNRADMDDRDEQALRQFLVEQSGFISKFAARVYSGEMSERAVRVHAEMWANKSLRGAFLLGKASAAWNVPHIWILGQTETHCPDCKRLAGQIHRMRDWRKRGWYPGSGKLDCNGFNCDCKLDPVPGERARGRY